MSFAGPSFLSRLLRPFTSSATMSVSAGANGAAAAAAALPEGAEKATIAAGCFWGVEHMYRKHFGGKGLYDARVGYIGGDTSSPSYRAVCSGTTGREFFFLPVVSPRAPSFIFFFFLYAKANMATSCATRQTPKRHS